MAGKPPWPAQNAWFCRAPAPEREATPLESDCTVGEIERVLDYDGVPILPSPNHSRSARPKKALPMMQASRTAELAVGAWCHRARVLAAANVTRAKRIVGCAADKDVIEQAGGIFVGHDRPPMAEARLVTGARSDYDRARNAGAVRVAVIERLAEVRSLGAECRQGEGVASGVALTSPTHPGNAAETNTGETPRVP